MGCLGAVLEAVLEPLGGVLGPLGGISVLLGPSWRRLGAILGGLGGSWGGLGPLLEGSCFSKVSRFKKRQPDYMAFYRNPYRTGDLGPFCRDPYGTLIYPKSMARAAPDRGGGDAAAPPGLSGFRNSGRLGRIREGKEDEQVGKGIGLCTPCAGTRPGAADPQRSKAAIPPPRRKQCSQVVLNDFGVDLKSPARWRVRGHPLQD